MINWSGYQWLTQERWGKLHTDKPFVWYDAECVCVNKDESLSLLTKLHEKDLIVKDKIYKSKYGVGLVSNTTEFGYGYFEIEAKIPKTDNNWSAFWMWSFDSWPPEIDIFESYTNSKGSLFNIFNNWKIWNIWNIQTNVFYKDNNKVKSIKGKKHWINIFKASPNKRFVKYGLDWQENYIKFYYDGRLVKTIKDNFVLFKMKNKKMNVIINNSLRKEPTEANSEFIINYFIYRKQK